MKKYRVYRDFVKHQYGSPWSALTTCVREFDTVEEALKCVEQLQNMFPDNYILDSGSVGRAVDLIDKRVFDGIEVNIVTETNVFWSVLEHGDGLPMPVRLDKYLE